jgi:hypothetical protein
VYVSVSEKIDTDLNQTREAMEQIKEYVADKFRAVLGTMQQVRRNADEISTVHATFSGVPRNFVRRGGFNKFS